MRQGCFYCFRILNPDDAENKLRDFIQCQECSTLYHSSCWVQGRICLRCSKNDVQSTDIPPPPPFLIETRKPLPLVEASASLYFIEKYKFVIPFILLGALIIIFFIPKNSEKHLSSRKESDPPLLIEAPIAEIKGIAPPESEEKELFLNLSRGANIRQEPTSVGSCILGRVSCGAPVTLLETIQDYVNPTRSWHHIRTKNNLRGWFVAEPGENSLLEDDPKPAKASLTQLARYSSPQRRFVNNIPGINVRTEPSGRNCSTLATLPYGQPVEILGESYSKYDSQERYTWYYLRSDDGIEGWTFAGSEKEWFTEDDPKAVPVPQKRFANHPDGAYINIRQGATTTTCPLASLSCGSSLDILRRAPGETDSSTIWYYIRTRYGQEGWVFAGDAEEWLTQKDPKIDKHSLLDSDRYLTSQRRFVNHAKGINLRIEPTASGCSTIATLPFGLPVEILGGAPSVLDDQYTWYYIRTNDGLEGWAYAGEPQEKWFIDRIP